MPRTFEIHAHLGPLSATGKQIGHAFLRATICGTVFERKISRARHYINYLEFIETDMGGGDASIVATQSGSDVVVEVSLGSDTTTTVLSGKTLGPAPPYCVLGMYIGNEDETHPAGQVSIGPMTVIHSGVRRHYHWVPDYEWVLRRDIAGWFDPDPSHSSWNNWQLIPPHTTFSNGTITMASEPQGWEGNTNDISFAWYPSFGPSVVTMSAGTPRHRLVQNRARNAWTVQIHVETDSGDGDGFVGDPLYHGDFGTLRQVTAYDAFVSENGQMWCVIGSITSGSGSVMLGSTSYRPDWDGKVWLPESGMLIKSGRYDPEIVQLYPSADVLVATLDDTNDIHVTRLCATVGGTIIGYTVGDDHSVGRKGLSLGGIWKTEDGRIGLAYTDLDGVAQSIFSDASCGVWTP